MSNLYSLIHRRPYGVCVPRDGGQPTPEEYADFIVACEYRDLDEDQQHGARLFVDGKESAFGTTFTAKKGQSIQLEVDVVGNEAADFMTWSDGKKSSKITVVAGEFSEITAVVSKVGTEENPIKVRTLTALEKLRDEVAAGDCKEGVYFRQEGDIDLDGIPWSGIGLMSPTTPKYDPDPDHTFKGVYDGNGHVIDNLVIHCESTDTGKANRYKALFRTAGYGATIKNLTVNVKGVDHWEEEDIMAAAIVGVTDGGLTIENCTANGTLGTLEQPLDNSAGILCRIAVPPAH